MARVAWETKGEDITVLDVMESTSWTSYMVMVTVFSRPQLNAMIARLEKRAFELGHTPFNSRGKSAWEVLDFGEVVCHIFSKDMREYYDLESFYGTAVEVPLPFDDEAANAEWRTRV